MGPPQSVVILSNIDPKILLKAIHLEHMPEYTDSHPQ